MRRTVLALITFFALAGVARTQAQSVSGVGSAKVTVIAHLTIPDMLVLSAVPAKEKAHRDGEFQQLDGALTLYVSANRNWRLVMDGSSAADLAWRAASSSTRVRPASTNFTVADAQVEVAQGKSGTALPIRVDYRWVSSNSSSHTPPVVYSLTAS